MTSWPKERRLLPDISEHRSMMARKMLGKAETIFAEEKDNIAARAGATDAATANIRLQL
jgi:hypothetical protein